MKKNKEVDKYIESFPKETQKMLQQLREIIFKAAPKAEEVISYKMPAYKYFGMLVYYAGYEHHIGLYPMPTAIKQFKKELSVYKTAVGSVQFPLTEKLPGTLISKIIKFRAQENVVKAEAIKNLKTCSKGHNYYKSSDCPTCPICEQQRKPKEGFLSLLVAPARRALENKKITNLEQLSKYSEKEITELHGMGPSTLPKLRKALKTKGLTFKKQ